ncbi:GNAT family N-acetyltransferase [Niallia sp. Sow4_A1]|jgi:GNAT superfamily N-acetyltransferase|uniref:GNAT family N-acetyltransferase n=1 Tax=Niallia hominis TaxID=3133173 RepID=A0ABV1F052_9BACI|nr:GNAT family N-acetyltransferase [Niallia circulans]MCF2648314.1 GNAT family N-acetyltransferase [Niallia circulans]
MSKYQLISDYKDNEIYKNSFIELAKQVFKIDFSRWDQLGCWNDDYICYSFLDGDKVIANVSINKMDIILHNKMYKSLQLGTVMTHPDYRNKGLSAKLINHIIAKYENLYDFIYLFANPSVLDFYPKFGFGRMQESNFYMEMSADFYNKEERPSNPRKLDVNSSEDFRLIKRIAENRIPVSTICGVKQNNHLLFFYLIEVFNEMTFYFEKEEVIVICEKIENKLYVYDVISTYKVDFEVLLQSFSTDKVIFHFIPDDLKSKGNYIVAESSDVLFIRHARKIENLEPILFPLTSHA